MYLASDSLSKKVQILSQKKKKKKKSIDRQKRRLKYSNEIRRDGTKMRGKCEIKKRASQSICICRLRTCEMGLGCIGVDMSPPMLLVNAPAATFGNGRQVAFSAFFEGVTQFFFQIHLGKSQNILPFFLKFQANLIQHLKCSICLTFLSSILF